MKKSKTPVFPSRKEMKAYFMSAWTILGFYFNVVSAFFQKAWFKAYLSFFGLQHITNGRLPAGWEVINFDFPDNLDKSSDCSSESHGGVMYVKNRIEMEMEIKVSERQRIYALYMPPEVGSISPRTESSNHWHAARALTALSQRQSLSHWADSH
jgi:hypothetical protein